MGQERRGEVEFSFIVNIDFLCLLGDVSLENRVSPDGKPGVMANFLDGREV
jgi:hypothetical protein